MNNTYFPQPNFSRFEISDLGAFDPEAYKKNTNIEVDQIY